MRRLTILVSISLFSIIVALLITEIFLRVFWYPNYLNQKYQRDDIRWLSKNVELNSFGYRGKDVDYIKQENTFRIYILGDSYTFGWYIDNPNHSYPNVLESKLRESFKQKNIEVINAAKPGFNFTDEVNRLKNEGVLFNPDLVIIGINSQDLSMHEYPPRFTKNQFLNNLRIYQLTFGNIERARVAHATFNEIQETYSSGSKQLQKAEMEFSQAKKLADSINSKLAIIIFPEYNPSNPNETYRYQSYHDQVKKLADKYSIVVVDLLPFFSKVTDKSALVLNPVDPHPSILADRLAAEAIIQSLDFNKFINLNNNQQVYEKTISLNDILPNFNGITNIKPPGWVYFNRKFGLNIQKNFLPTQHDKTIFYLEDLLKTAKLATHKGWPGAKIEYNLPGNLGQLSIPTTLYTYHVIGISQIDGYWRENGGLHSEGLDLSQLDITKDDKKISIKIMNSNKYELFRVIVDIAVSQFDIDNNKVVAIAATQTKTMNIMDDSSKIKFEFDNPVGSIPVFTKEGQDVNYLWVNNRLISAKFNTINNDVEVVLPQGDYQGKDIEVSVSGLISEIDTYPTIQYR